MFYREAKGGLVLFVHLIPKGGRDAATGVEQAADGKSYLHVRVRAIPEQGRANKALVKFLAGEMKMPPSAFTLASGARSRFKHIHISGDYAVLVRLCHEKFFHCPATTPCSW